MIEPEERLRKIRLNTGVQWHVLERDYLLSWILFGISKVPLLSDTLVFKGGTVLRKCYFEDYRFSEDLDFTGLPAAPRDENMENFMREACETARREMLKESVSVDAILERYIENRPHPENQEAFRIRARLPWHNYPLTSIKIEISMDEKIHGPVQTRKIIHHYGEPLEAEIKTYSLEEIVAEKLRAILQNADMLKKRGWIRPRARDYYDLWRILGTYKDDMDLADFSSLLRHKCAAKNISFTSLEDFFDDNLLSRVEKAWYRSLAPLMSTLPSYSSVTSELREQVKVLLFSQ